MKVIHFQEIVYFPLLCPLHLQSRHWDESQRLLGRILPSLKCHRYGDLCVLLLTSLFIQVTLLKCICYLLVLMYILSQCYSHNFLENMRQLLKWCLFVRKEANGRCIFLDRSRCDSENTPIDKGGRKMKRQ